MRKTCVKVDQLSCCWAMRRRRTGTYSDDAANEPTDASDVPLTRQKAGCRSGFVSECLVEGDEENTHCRPFPSSRSS